MSKYSLRELGFGPHYTGCTGHVKHASMDVGEHRLDWFGYVKFVDGDRVSVFLSESGALVVVKNEMG